MEKNIVSPSGSYTSVASGTILGKRKLRPIDLPEFSWPEESLLKDIRGNTHEYTSIQRERDAYAMRCQFLDRLHRHNGTTETRLTGNSDSQRYEIEYSNNMPLSNELQPLKHEEQFQKLEVQTGETPKLPSWILEKGNIRGQSESKGLSSIPSYTSIQRERDAYAMRCQFLDRFHHHSDTTETRLTGNSDSERYEIEYSNNMPLSNELQPLKHEEQFQQLEVQTGETPKLPSWILEKGNIRGQSESKGSSSIPSYTSYIEKSQRKPVVQHTSLTKTPLATFCTDDLSVTRRATGIFQQSSSQPDCSNILSDKRASMDEVNEFDTSCSFGQRGQVFQKIESNNAPKACAEQKDIQTEGHSNVRDSEGFDKENKKSSLVEEFASRYGHNPDKSFILEKQKKLNHGSHRLEEKSRSKLDKSSLAAEKIWDGSLQLNSSIAVPAVAFFKSGEKLLDVNWSEFVDVKGKVRLEAFEKYIQELSRSRNRGLMVISLCSNEGSETEIKHMKEVAKGYIKGERVGLARLAPGVDLYLCPRTNTIITILAKHGFFKGLAAIESKCELFIGCVVWRKNHTASASVAKKSDSKTNNSQSEQLQKSLPNSIDVHTASASVAKKSESKTNNSQSEQLQKSLPDSIDAIDVPTVGKSSLSLVKDAQALASAKSSSVAENNGIKDDKNTGVDNSSSNTISLPTSTRLKKPSSPAEKQESVPSKSKSQGTPWHVLNSGTCYAEPARENMELPKYSLSLPSNASSQKKPFNDDDLPEFDFGSAGGISISSEGKSSDAYVLNKNRTEDGSGNLTGYLAHSVSISKPTASTTNVDAPPHREVSVHGPPLPLSRQMEGRHAYQSHSIPPTVGTTPRALPKIPFADSGKKIFFDDDDMPEWLPPNLKKQSFAKRSNIPADMPQSTTNPGFKNLPFHHHPPRPLPPFPTPAPSPPMLSSLAVSPVLHPPFNSKVPPPVPSRDGPSYMTGFTFNPVLQPPSRDGPSYMTGFTFNPVLQPPSGPLAVKNPLQPAGGVWRP